MKNLVVALGNTEWEPQFVSALSHPMNGLRIQRRCVDGVDVRAAIQLVEVDAVLLSDHTTRVDEDLFLELDARGIAVIALSNEPDRWVQLGVVRLVSIDERNVHPSVSLVSGMMRDGTVELTAPQEPSGRLIAVAGFGGAAGRSACTRELGWQLAQAGRTTLMVDADTYNASLHQELQRESATSGLLDVCRAHETRKLSADSFSNHADKLTDRLHLLSGLPRSSRWMDLRSAALIGVWSTARSAYENVVVDVGPVLENDQTLLHDTHLPRRHSAALTALEAAQTTVLCARADAVGIARLIKGFHEYHELFTHTQVHVVVWGSARSPSEVSKAISRHTGLHSIIYVAREDALMQEALMKGQPASALKPKSGLAIGYEDLKSQLDVTADDITKKRLARVLHLGRTRAAA